MDRVAQHETMLTAHALEGLAAIPGVRVYGDPDPAHASARLGVITFNIEALPHALVAAILSTEYAIGVRNGCFCAHPCLMHLLGIDAAEAAELRRDLLAGDRRAMPGMVRISFGLYNTLAEIDAFVAAIKVIARGEFAGVYTLDQAGGYAAVGFAPDLAAHFGLRLPQPAPS